MPTNRQRLIAAVASVAITVGGAWIASQVPSSPADAAGTEPSEAGLSVKIKGLRNDTGKVIVMVFDDGDAYEIEDYENAVAYQEVEARSGLNAFTFPKLKAGPYAIVAFHDENGDRDLNMDGETPTEGYATSGAIDAYDTPNFKRAAVPASEVTIDMHYPR